MRSIIDMLLAVVAALWLSNSATRQPPSGPHCSDRGFDALEAEVSLPGFRTVADPPESEAWARSACGASTPEPYCRTQRAVYRCTLIKAAINAVRAADEICDKVNALNRNRPWPSSPAKHAWKTVADYACDASASGVLLDCTKTSDRGGLLCSVAGVPHFQWPVSELGPTPVLLSAVACAGYTCVPAANKTVYETAAMFRPYLDCCV